MAHKTRLIAALAAVAALAAPATYAADVSHSPQAINLTDNSGFFGDAFGMNHQGSTFTDMFTFAAVAGGSLDAIVSSIARNSGTGLDITAFDLYSGTPGGGGGGGALVANGSQSQSGTTDIWTLTANNLSGGNYWLQVSGHVQSNGSGAFGGAMTAAVPEPSSYAMLLGGLGLLGLMARRRRR